MELHVDGFISILQSGYDTIKMCSYRTDMDSLGSVKVPSDAYYGPFTSRAKEQYKVTGRAAHHNLIKSFVMIKRSAALANKELNALDADRADAIVKVCDEIMAGKLLDQFLIEEINSGAGTAFNMNVNEVIANRALFAITSFTFILNAVPAPEFISSIKNWSSNLPAIISSHTFTIASALSASRAFSSLFANAAERFIITKDLIRLWCAARPVTLYCSLALLVKGP